MIITCNECNSSFKVEDSLIKENGSKVRCSKCETIFVAYPPTPEEDLKLDPDEQLLGSDGNIVLDNLDSTLDDFFNEEASIDTAAPAKDADQQLELGLGLDVEPEWGEESPPAVFDSEETDLDLDELQDLLEAENTTDDSFGELDLDLDLGADSDLTTNVDAMVDEELPDLENLEDLTALEDESLGDDEIESVLEDLDLDLEAEKEPETIEGELSLNDSPDLEDIELGEKDSSDFEKTSVENLEYLEQNIQPDMLADNQIADTDPEVVETDKMDLSDLELENDEEPVAEKTSVEEPDEVDLDLQLDSEGETPAGVEVVESDELDLSDLELESYDMPVTEKASPKESEELDLDLQLELESEASVGEEITGADAEVAESDELDLSDLELEGDDVPVAEKTGGTEPEELDLELDLSPEAVTDDSAIGSDSLDLSDLEEIIDSEPEDNAEDAIETLEMDLEHQNDEKAMSAEFEDAVDDNELDFSDLEKMLESGETPTAEAENQEADDLELQFDIDEQPTGDVNPETSSDIAEDFEEDGLLDIEKILAEGGDTADEDSDSPLEMESALDGSSSGEDELELDFDLEGELKEKEKLSDDGDSGDELLESSLIASGEIEEEEAENESLQAATADAIVTDELGETKDAYSQTDVSSVADGRPSIPPARVRKSRSKVPVLAAVLLLLLAGGILIVPNMLGIKIPYISDIKIPYVSDLLSPKAKDVAGNLEIIPLGDTINARFVEDSEGSRLLVIHGKIKNDYDHPRSFIKVTGKIYQKGGKLAKAETVYCGNVLSDSELSGMNIAKINKRLHNRFGDKKSNFKVKTGESVPFMIVFDNLPQNLDEYTVEVEGSSI